MTMTSHHRDGYAETGAHEELEHRSQLPYSRITGLFIVIRCLLTFHKYVPIMGCMGIAIKRIYEEPAASDGFRVLVDRLWPRGMTKERAALDLWLKAAAPSPSLRKWFGHDPAKFAEFRARYVAELDTDTAVKDLRRICTEHPDVTLLYAAKDPQVNHALVLRDYLIESLQ